MKPRTITGIATILIAALLLPGRAAAQEINACKHLVITDFTEDPYGIARELRAQARAGGMNVVSAPSEVATADRFRTCNMLGSWSVAGSSGQLTVRVVDLMGGSVIAEARAGGTNWWGVDRTVRNAVKKIYQQLRYTAYSETVYQARIRRLYPTRPKLPVTESELKSRNVRSAVEGIWTDLEDKYRIAVVAATEGSGADYIAVILRSASPVWEPGEIKAEFRATASPTVFTSTYFMENKQAIGTTFALQGGAVLKASAPTPSGPTDLSLIRVWPAVRTDDARSVDRRGGASGTGFLVTRAGLIATNWHVVEGATSVAVHFPGMTQSVVAEVVMKDATNDLALLRAADPQQIRNVCGDRPFQLVSASRVQLGERVSTIGYPMESILGSNPKFSEGVVASKTGVQDDPRSLQISAEVQPGSSGGPLFDSSGNVIGVVVATADAARFYAVAGTLPQNVNWAVKSDYLLSLLSMLPADSPSPRTTSFSPEKASKCVALITAR